MLQTSLALILFLFPLAYSPGPGNLFFAANGARFGFWATLPATIGYHLATWAVTAAMGFGFLAFVVRYPQVFTALKLAGAVYVLWIAWTMLRAGMMRGLEEARPATFGDGVMLLVLNPKAYVIIAVMFSQFLDLTGVGLVASVLLITTVFTLNNLLAFAVWTMAGDALAGLFRSSDSVRKMNVIFGALLAAVGVWILLA